MIPAMAYPLAKPATICSILREAITIPEKNPKLISSLFLISFLFSYLLLCAFQLSTYSPTEITTISAYPFTTSPRRPAFNRLAATLRRDTKALLAVELACLIISQAVSYILTTINVYAVAATYAGKLLTLKELLSEVRSVIKRAVFTQFLLLLLNEGYLMLLIVTAVVLAYVANGSIFWLGLLVSLAVAGVVWYFYLLSLCSLSVVVSVVEEGHCGVRAISRAAELMRGSKWRATVISFIILVAALVISGAYIIGRRHLNFWGQFGARLIYALVLQVLNFFLSLGAFVVLYYECKRSHGEGTPDMVCKLGYSSLPPTYQVNDV